MRCSALALVVFAFIAPAGRAEEPLRLGSPAMRTLSQYTVSITPDGKQLVYRSGVDTLTIAEPKTGKVIRTLTITEKGIGELFFFTRDGKHIVLNGMQDYRLLDVRTGKIVHTFAVTDRFDSARREMYWSGDGKLLLWMKADFMSTSPLQLWDANAGEALGETLHIQSSKRPFAAISGDGKLIATGAYEHSKKADSEPAWNEYIELWDAATRKVKARMHLGERQVPFGIALSHDGKLLAARVEGKDGLQLWDTSRQKRIAVLEKIEGFQIRFTFSPDGQQLAVQSDRGQTGLFETATGKKLVAKGTPGYPVGVGFAEGDVLACNASGSEISVVSLTAKDAPPPAKPTGHSRPVMAVHFSADGKTILTAGEDNRLIRWDAKTGQVIETVIATDPKIGSVWNYPSRFSPDGKYLIAGSFNRIALIDVEGKKDMGFLTNSRKYFARWDHIDFSTDGKTVYARGTAQESTDTGLKLGSVSYVASWDLATGKLKSEFSGPVRGSPDELFAKHYGKEKLAPAPGKDESQPEVIVGPAVRDPWASRFNAGPLLVGNQITVKDRTSQKVLFDKLLTASSQNKSIGICISPDGKRLAVPLVDATVLIFELDRK